jgi:hypothetical protein
LPHNDVVLKGAQTIEVGRMAFAAVFHGIDTKLVSFIEVSSVVQNTRQAG